MEIQKLGQGAFTKAFKVNDRVGLVSWDDVRECQANGWFPDSPLFPVIEFAPWDVDKALLSRTRNNRHCKVYMMDFYETVKAPKKQLDCDQYALYKELRTINGRMGYSYLHELFLDLNVPRETYEALCAAVDALANYGEDIVFEISPRNISCNNGKLVLRDCFFFVSQFYSR